MHATKLRDQLSTRLQPYSSELKSPPPNPCAPRRRGAGASRHRWRPAAQCTTLRATCGTGVLPPGYPACLPAGIPSSTAPDSGFAAFLVCLSCLPRPLPCLRLAPTLLPGPCRTPLNPKLQRPPAQRQLRRSERVPWQPGRRLLPAGVRRLCAELRSQCTRRQLRGCGTEGRCSGCVKSVAAGLSSACMSPAPG